MMVAGGQRDGGGGSSGLVVIMVVVVVEEMVNGTGAAGSGFVAMKASARSLRLNRVGQLLFLLAMRSGCKYACILLSIHTIALNLCDFVVQGISVCATRMMRVLQ